MKTFQTLVEYTGLEEEDFKPYLKLFPNTHISDLYLEAFYLSEQTYGNFEDSIEGQMFSYMDSLIEDEEEWKFRDLEHLLDTLKEIYV